MQEFLHTADFRSVRWDGLLYHFTPTQARVVEALWQAHDQGTPALSYGLLKKYLRESCDSEPARVRDLFRRRGHVHPAWGTLIVHGPTRGTLMLGLGVSPGFNHTLNPTDTPTKTHRSTHLPIPCDAPKLQEEAIDVALHEE